MDLRIAEFLKAAAKGLTLSQNTIDRLIVIGTVGHRSPKRFNVDVMETVRLRNMLLHNSFPDSFPVIIDRKLYGLVRYVNTLVRSSLLLLLMVAIAVNT